MGIFRFFKKIVLAILFIFGAKIQSYAQK